MLCWAHRSHCRLLCCRKTRSIPQNQAFSEKFRVSNKRAFSLLPDEKALVGAFSVIVKTDGSFAALIQTQLLTLSSGDGLGPPGGLHQLGQLRLLPVDGVVQVRRPVCGVKLLI